MSAEAEQRVYAKLKEYRSKTDITIRPTPLLRQAFTDYSGTKRDLKLRYYQVQMILHLLAMRRFVVGDDTGLGKTLESIAACCYVWEKEPNVKVLVLTKKSAVTQWRDEVLRFTQGVNVVTVKGNKNERQRAYDEFQAHTGPTVMVAGYRSLTQDFTAVQSWKWDLVIFDEATVFKTPKTYVHQVCRHISNEAQRVWGLTATLIKNNLVEGYGIYKVILPDLFKHTPATFVTDYCDVEMINIGKNRKVPRIVGYKTVDILRFRDKISPFYLGRPKHEVASELPPLTTIVRKVALEPFQALKYQEALAGLLTVRKDGEFAEKEVSKLVAVTYCQEITNHPGLIGFPEEDSDKLNELLDMLTEGDLAGEKVIIFTRFAKMVDIGVQALASAKIKSVRITGAEGEDARKAAQDTFQNTNSGTNVVWITTAGSDAINLQAAKAIIFYDTPFSAGDYLQVLGRMIRIGSIHDRVFAYHLVARDTVDERVMAIIESKMELIERVLGKRIKGEDDDEMDLLKVGVGDISALFEMLKTDAAKGYIRVA
jgi:SNF2 family DNA or RNA helicase